MSPVCNVDGVGAECVCWCCENLRDAALAMIFFLSAAAPPEDSLFLDCNAPPLLSLLLLFIITLSVQNSQTRYWWSLEIVAIWGYLLRSASGKGITPVTYSDDEEEEEGGGNGDDDNDGDDGNGDGGNNDDDDDDDDEEEEEEEEKEDGSLVDDDGGDADDNVDLQGV